MCVCLVSSLFFDWSELIVLRHNHIILITSVLTLGGILSPGSFFPHTTTRHLLQWIPTDVLVILQTC